MRYGSLFSGYAGLDTGVQSVLGGDTAWFCEIEKAPAAILAHHWPNVSNLGDITAVDWSAVEPVDVLTGGFPCQDVSHAGKRRGLKPGTRSGLWAHMAYAIDQLRPRIVIAENVRGLLSAEAGGDLEPCPWCVGDGERGALRALGAVLGDLADLGYDAWWYGLRAADVGAPHGRFRVFVIAHPALMPTPRATDGTKGGPHQRGSSGDLMLPSAVTLLPTPAVNDMGEGKTVEAWDEWTAKMQATHANGNGHGKSLAIEAQRLLPTPKTQNRASRKALTQQHWTRPGLEQAIELADGTLPREYESWAEVQGNQPSDWGQYADAIARWEALTRPAPAPTQPSKKGTPQLSPAFSEWMMGLPAGHVTAVPGLSRNEQLKALGNGVVPQQAAAALRLWLATVSEVAA